MARQLASHPQFGGRLVVLDDDARLRAPYRTAQVYVDFGEPASGVEQSFATAWVDAPWAGEDTVILCTPAGRTTVDHDPVDACLDEVRAYAANRVPGAGFDLFAYAPNGTWGRHLFQIIG